MKGIRSGRKTSAMYLDEAPKTFGSTGKALQNVFGRRNRIGIEDRHPVSGAGLFFFGRKKDEHKNGILFLPTQGGSLAAAGKKAAAVVAGGIEYTAGIAIAALRQPPNQPAFVSADPAEVFPHDLAVQN